jgi:hypothetical protein
MTHVAKTKPPKGLELLREHVYGSRRGEDAGEELS